jgi:hypothetical protein
MSAARILRRYFPRPPVKSSPDLWRRLVDERARRLLAAQSVERNAFAPSEYHCVYCGHAVAAFGVVLTADIAASLALPWAKPSPCPRDSCESDAVVDATGEIIPRESGVFRRR